MFSIIEGDVSLVDQDGTPIATTSGTNGNKLEVSSKIDSVVATDSVFVREQNLDSEGYIKNSSHNMAQMDGEWSPFTLDTDGRLRVVMSTVSEPHDIHGSSHYGILDDLQIPEHIVRDSELLNTSGTLQTQLDSLEGSVNNIPDTFVGLVDTPGSYAAGKYVISTMSGIGYGSSFIDYSLYVSPNYTGNFSDGSITHPFKDLISLVDYAYTTYTGINDTVTVFLLPGEYVLNDTSSSTSSVIKTIIGTNYKTTIIKPTINVIGKPLLDNNIPISNITLDATDIPDFRTTPGSIGYKAAGGYSQIDIHNCIIKGFHSNLSSINNSNIRVIGGEFSDTTLNITVGSGSSVSIDSSYLYDAIQGHIYTYGDAVVDLKSAELSSLNYTPVLGTGIWATEDSHVNVFGGTNLHDLNKNIVVKDDAAVEVDNCVLEPTISSVGIEQLDNSSLLIINSRAQLGNENVYIESPANVYINSYDSSNGEVTIGTGADVDADLFSVNNGQLKKPRLVYKSDSFGRKALLFNNTTDGQKFATGVEGTNAQVDVDVRVLGSNAFNHEVSINLISEQGGVSDGWKIVKGAGITPAIGIRYIDDTKAIQFNPDGTTQLNSGVAVDKILDEDDFVSNDPSALVTQQSTKAFIENTTYSKADIDAGQLNIMYYTESEINTLSGILDSRLVHVDGSNELTNDWNAGNYEITANGFVKGSSNIDLAIFGVTTGVLSGGAISVNLSNDTLLDVASGTCLYVDMGDRSDPVVEVLSWDSQTIDPDLSGFRTKWVGIYRTGPGEGSVIVDNEFTQEEKRTVSVLGRFWGQGDAHITTAKNYTTPAFGLGKTVEDFLYAMGAINIKGNVFSAATISGTPVMQLYRTAGESFRFSANYGDSPLSPNVSVSDNEVYSLYQYHIQSSYTNIPKYAIDPNYYDNGGVITAVPSEKWTVQYVYYFPVSHVLHLTYGQHLYDSPTLAMDGIFKDSYNIIPDVSYGAILRCYIILKAGATRIDDVTQGIVIDTVGNSGMIPGTTNHGELGGLQDDDHPQYLNLSRGDDRYYTQSEIDSISGTIANNCIRRDGTSTLIADWDAGDYDVTAAGFVHGRTRVEYASYTNITGILTGGEITVNSSDNTLVDIAAGKSLYVDMSDREDPLIEVLTWEAQTLAPNLVDVEIKWLGIQRIGAGMGQVISSYSFSQADKRTITILGRCWNFIGTATVEGVGNYKVGAFSFGKVTQDLAYAMGAFNISGNVFYPTVSGSMTLSRSEGEAFRLGANFANDNNSPNICISATSSGIDSYSYHIQGGGLTSHYEIDANYYDLNGTRTVVSTGKWTVQRVYHYPGSDVVLIVYGQFMYDTYAEALEAIKTERLILNTNTLDGAVLRAFIIIKEGCLDLTDSDTAVVLEATSTAVGGTPSVTTGVTNHANLTGLGNDDHYQYILVDGSRAFSNKTGYGTHPEFSTDTDIVDKKYVDDEIANLTTDHGELVGLGDDDHIQYSKADGSREYTGIVSYSTINLFTTDNQIVDKSYVDSAVVTHHGELSGLTDDDHIQYLKTDGARNLIGKQSYNSHPAFINDTELVDKKYVDDEIANLTADHGELVGLGDDDHPQYHSDARGDIRYYTKTQLDTILANHHSPTSADHDDRYYTETEVDTFVTGLSNDLQTAIDTLAVGELPSCQLRQTINTTLYSTWINMEFNNTDIENNTDVIEHDVVDNYKLNIKQSGLYLISYNTQIGTTVTNSCSTRILKNGTTVLNGSDSSILVYSNERHVVGHSFLTYLQQNDYIALQLLFSSNNQATAFSPTTLIITSLQGMKGLDGAAGADGVPGSGSSLIIKEDSVNVPNTPHSAINFIGDSVTVTDVGNGVVDVDIATPTSSVFGTYFAWSSDESTTGTTSVNFQRKTTLSVNDIPSGYYRLGWYFEWKMNSTSSDTFTRIIVNDSAVVMEHNEEAKDVSNWQTASGHVITQLLAGDHTFGLDYSVENNGVTSYIRRARLEFWRVE